MIACRVVIISRQSCIDVPDGIKSWEKINGIIVDAFEKRGEGRPGKTKHTAFHILANAHVHLTPMVMCDI
jgi:hypothetical protein